MKRLAILFLTSLSVLYSQITEKKAGTEYPEPAPFGINDFQEKLQGIWVVDTCKQYTGIGIAWYPIYKYYVVSRSNTGKKIQSVKQKRQNNTWTPYEQYFYSYGYGDSLISKITQQWDSTQNKWINSKKIEYRYDSITGNLLEFIEYGWLNIWTPSSRILYAYDSVGNNTSVTYQNYDFFFGWKNDSRWTHVYNAAGKVTESINQEWNNSNSDWENRYKYTYSYDPNSGKKTEVFYFTWNNGGWGIVKWRELFSYDSNGNLTEQKRQNYILMPPPNLPIWRNESRYTHTYVNNKLMESVKQNWDTTGNVWRNERRNLFSYNTNGKQILQKIQNWDTGGNQWINYILLTNDYNSAGQLTLHMRQIWDIANSVWVNSYKSEYILSEFILTNLGQTNENTLMIYPNPAEEYLYIKNSSGNAFSIRILSLTGQVLTTSHLFSDKTRLEIQSLPSGVYLVELRTKDGKKTYRRFIKR